MGIPQKESQQIVDANQQASYTLNYTGSNLTSVVKVVNGTTYTLTLGYTGSQLTTVSTWVKS